MRIGFNCVVDAFWGSSGKGKLAAALAMRYPIKNASSSNMPNAGHTVITPNGRKIVSKILPSACSVNPDIKAYVSPASAFWPEQLTREIADTDTGLVYIHERAIVMNQEMVDAEQVGSIPTIASTGQGAGEAQVSRIRREFVLAETSNISHPRVSLMSPTRWVNRIVRTMTNELWLHEVSQGFALGLQYGSHYPHCTSRDCNATQAAADMGLPPELVGTGDVYLNVRSFPIRVGNTEMGYSGDFMSREDNTTLEEIAVQAGIPDSEMETLRGIETTTVTKRPRRFSKLNYGWLQHAARQNGATKIALNFVQYFDWRDHQCREWNKISQATRQVVEKIETLTNVPVVWIGTGREFNDQIWRG